MSPYGQDISVLKPQAEHLELKFTFKYLSFMTSLLDTTVTDIKPQCRKNSKFDLIGLHSLQFSHVDTQICFYLWDASLCNTVMPHSNADHFSVIFFVFVCNFAFLGVFLLAHYVLRPDWL